MPTHPIDRAKSKLLVVRDLFPQSLCFLAGSRRFVRQRMALVSDDISFVRNDPALIRDVIALFWLGTELLGEV